MSFATPHIQTTGAADVLTSVQPTPSATNNVSNRNSIFKDAAGITWFVDVNGDAIQMGSTAASSLTGKLAPVLDILDTPPTTLNNGDSYIVKATATGAWAGQEGKIATWDDATNSWLFVTPADGDKTTITTGASAGIWQYSSGSNTWTQVEQGISIPTPSLTVAAGNVKFPRFNSQQNGISTNTPMALIQNRSIWAWGTDIDFNTGERANNNALFRETPVVYNNLVDGSYANQASSFPLFVDFAATDNYGLAIDSVGEVWATGGAVNGTGMTTVATGTTAITVVPGYAWYPVGFFSTLTDKAAKVYTSSHTSTTTPHSMVIMQNGDAYVTGSNNNGQLGLGDTTNRAQWVKFPIANVKYAILGQAFTVVVTSSGNVYFAGSDNGPFAGATVGNRTTPVLVTSAAATYEKSVAISPATAPQTIWVVKANNTLFAGGTNASGQQGRGNTTAVVGCTQVPGITNAKFVVATQRINDSVAMVRTDNTLSFAGKNFNGLHGFSGNAADNANNTSFVTPSASGFQGLVKDVWHGSLSTIVLTADGVVWGAGNLQSTGHGRGGAGVFADQNKFKQIAFSRPIVGMLAFNEGATGLDAYMLMNNIGNVYTIGPLTGYYTSGASGTKFAPCRLPFWGDTGETTVETLPMVFDSVGTITGATGVSATNILDGGSNQTVTFKVSYTGGTFGVVDVSGSTLTGPDITQVSQTTTSVSITGTTGTFDLVYVINAADIAALVAPNTQSQSYTIDLKINGV